ncbi:MAG: hypothetical protein HY010_05375 [Acidobacteria bacterium]|nr:hypothetical protein [Acidobacteriota bacterium]
MNTKIRFAGLAAMLTLAIMASASPMWGQQLNARKDKTINGVQAELRGNFRVKGGSTRLNSELDNINIPVGTKVAFCLLQNGVKTLLGVGQVAMVAGVPTAVVELNTNDGDTVPTVLAGDVLQARQKKIAPFKTAPNCGSALLLSAAFQ